MEASRIVIDPAIMLGKPVIKGTRIPVELLLRKLAQHLSPGEILEEYPQLKREDLQAAVDYAATSLEDERVYPVSLRNT